MWNPNLHHFQTIQKTDPLLWLSMTEVAKALENSGSRYIDDHNPSPWRDYDYKTDPLDHIVICQRYHNNGDLITSLEREEYDRVHPVGWVFPGPFMRVTDSWFSCLCKNPLYVDEHGRPHLTTRSTGHCLVNVDFEVLRKGDVADQLDNYTGITEKNFVLPTMIFIRTLLREQLKLI